MRARALQRRNDFRLSAAGDGRLQRRGAVRIRGIRIRARGEQCFDRRALTVQRRKQERRAPTAVARVDVGWSADVALAGEQRLQRIRIAGLRGLAQRRRGINPAGCRARG